jgi:hypothetical protein
MNFKNLACTTLLSIASSSQAAVVILDFEGVGDQNPVGNFYNGGAGTNFGIGFSTSTLALIDADSGGSGNFANEPSPNTIMFFLNGSDSILSIAAGFTTGFSFFYSSATAASVSVWDGLNGTGTQIASLSLSAQHTQNCVGDPNGTFCNWTAAGVAFNGTARSINFGGTAGSTGFDDITFGSATAGGGQGVPLPGTVALLGLGVIPLLARKKSRH